MPNYTDHPQNQHIVFLTADDLIQAGLKGEPIQLEKQVSEVRLTKDAGELLNELTEYQKDKHTGKWG